MQSNKLKRLLGLLTLLQAGNSAKVEFLAASLGCSQRTVFRDLELLRSSGVQVAFDDETGAHALRSPTASSQQLTEDEWLAVLMAASVSSLSRTDLFAGAVNQAIAKLMLSAPVSARQRFNRLVRAVVNENELPVLDTNETTTLRALIDAIDQRRRVELKFCDGEEVVQTVFSPYRTVYRDGAWNIEGRSEFLQRRIDIPLRSIQSAQLLAESYHVPVAYLQAGHTGSRSLRRRLRSIISQTEASSG